MLTLNFRKNKLSCDLPQHTHEVMKRFHQLEQQFQGEELEEKEERPGQGYK